METVTNINEIFETALKTQTMAEAFAGFVKTTPEHHAMRIKSCLAQFKKYYLGLSQDMEAEKNQCVVALVNVFYKQKNLRQINFVADMIRCCLNDGILQTKPVLDTLCRTELMNYTKKVHWCKTCELVKEFIDRVDYKGCRDVLHVMLTKIKQIPQNEWKFCQEQFMAVVKIVDDLLDPETCLLPGYHAVNEIRQYLNDAAIPPGHWTLVGKFAEFVDRFRATAAMVTTTGRAQLLPIVYHFSPPHTSTWRLDHETLKFQLRGQLPFDKSLYQKQSGLLQYILEQQYSREMVCHVLNLQKQQKRRNDAFEAELVTLLVNAMRKSVNDTSENYEQCLLEWQHLSCQIVYFVLFTYASLPQLVQSLYKQLSSENLITGRDHIMWVLLQYISGSIQKYSVSDFLPVIKLISYLYPEKQPLEVPNVMSPLCSHNFAAVSILIHLNNKIRSEANSNKEASDPLSDSTQPQECSIPISLQKQHDYLIQLSNRTDSLTMNDYKISLVLNAFSTVTEISSTPMAILMDSIYGDNPPTTIDLPGNCPAYAKINPLPMDTLDALTVHTKMSMIHSIVRKIVALNQNRANISLAPAVVETYSRLLVYMEIESIGVKALLTQVLPSTFKSKSWGIFNTLLEIFSYRLHHFQPQFRIQLLTSLQSLAPSTNHNQLHMSIESATLRMITSLDNADVKPQLARFPNEQKPIISQESEELNRVLVLTLARSIHITGAETISGTWCNDILKAIMNATPHRWAAHTLRCFPKSLQHFYQVHQTAAPNRHALAASIDNEYQNWEHILSTSSTQSNLGETEQDGIAHFSSHNSKPYFLCMLWKVLVGGGTFTPSVLKIVRQINPRIYSSHIRIFADYLVHEFFVDQGANTQRYLPILADVICKYDLVKVDQLILCLALRCYEGDNVKVAFFILQYLLMLPDFYRTVHQFAQENSSVEHWKTNMHIKHIEFHRQFPEKFFFEGLRDSLMEGEEPSSEQNKHLPVYFGNIALRFLPILDLVIHRTLELEGNNLEKLLDHFGPLYKLHERPITYVFNTLHYYESCLRDKSLLKKKLVSTIIASMNSNKPQNWALSQEYLLYIERSDEEIWEIRNSYFRTLVKRLVDTIARAEPKPFPSCDWRFNEFPNEGAHALHITCVELMALPMSSQDVGKSLMRVALQVNPSGSHDSIINWMNAVALILTTLPEVYWKSLHTEIQETIQTDDLTADTKDMDTYPFHLLMFSNQHLAYGDVYCTRVLALTHIVWHHMGIGYLSLVPQFLKDQVMPLVVTELQLLYVFNLIGPFLPRFQSERTRCMLDVCNVLYDMLLQVSNQTSNLRFCDEIADFLYHIKYMHVGTAVNDKVHEVMQHLQPSLQSRLKFLSTLPPSSGRSTSRDASMMS